MYRLEIDFVKRRRERDITKSLVKRAKPKASLFLFSALLCADPKEI